MLAHSQICRHHGWVAVNKSYILCVPKYTGCNCGWVTCDIFSHKTCTRSKEDVQNFPAARLMKKPVADDGDENTTRNIQACPTKSLCLVYRGNWGCQNLLGPAFLTSTHPPPCFFLVLTPWFASTLQDWGDYIWATSATSCFFDFPLLHFNPLHSLLSPLTVSFWSIPSTFLDLKTQGWPQTTRTTTTRTATTAKPQTRNITQLGAHSKRQTTCIKQETTTSK